MTETNKEDKQPAEIKTIESFAGDYSFLSNFYPCVIIFEGQKYNSTEHAYQAAKCKNIDDRAKFRESIKASKAKFLGKKVAMRPDWESVKLQIMYEVVKQKFSKYDNLKKLLLDTGEAEIIEGNNWNDTYFGVCNGKGMNHLGKILMRVRKELKG